MNKQYEYKFVAVKVRFTFQADKFRDTYQQEVHRQAQDGRPIRWNGEQAQSI